MNAIQERSVNTTRNGNVQYIGSAVISEDKPKTISLMAKLDEKSSEKIELTKGTIFLIGLVPVFLTLVLSYGGTVINWARSDQSKEERIIIIQTNQEKFDKRLESIENKMDKQIERQAEEDRKKAEVRGYELGLADSHKEKK